MKAVIVPEPGKVQIIEKSMPDIRGGNEVLVRVRLAGICGSDVHIYHGTSPVATYPRIIGHEVTGEIVAAGPDVTRVKVGDKVVLEPIRSCGNCYACRQGRKNVCANLQVYGVHLDGGYQPYLVLPEENVHKVGDYLSWEEAVLVEPFTIGAQANWRGDVKENDVVFIMGAGTIGLCALQIAKLKGAVCIVSDIFDSKPWFPRRPIPHRPGGNHQKGTDRGWFPAANQPIPRRHPVDERRKTESVRFYHPPLPSGTIPGGRPSDGNPTGAGPQSGAAI